MHATHNDYINPLILTKRIFRIKMSIQTFNAFCTNIYRLDQILGKQGSKAKDVYASKISLASRVVKVERSVSET